MTVTARLRRARPWPHRGLHRQPHLTQAIAVIGSSENRFLMKGEVVEGCPPSRGVLLVQKGSLPLPKAV
jgi:hypothetical protein